MRAIAPLVAAGITAASLVACGTADNSHCIPPPCPLPLAVQLRVSSAAGGLVPGLTVDLVGLQSGSVQCVPEASSSRCPVPGERGTYELRIAAPGFRTVEITVEVPGAAGPPCTCPTVEAQQVDVALVPS